MSLLCNPDLTTDLEEDRIFGVFDSDKQVTSARCYYQLKLARVLLEIKKHKDVKLGLKSIDLFELSRFQAADTAQEPESALDNSTLFKTATDIDLYAAPVQQPYPIIDLKPAPPVHHKQQKLIEVIGL